MKIKGAVFDMDGTLIDSLAFWEGYWKRLGKAYFNNERFVPDKQVDAAVRSLTFVDAQKLIKSFYHLDVTDEEFRRFSNDGVLDFYKNEVTVKDGVFAFLAHLKAQGIQTCIASATQMHVIRAALANLGLDKYFDFVFSCDDIGKSKDVPDIYLLSRDALGLREEEICVFEDSYVALQTAKRAGFFTVGIYDANNFRQDLLAASSDIYLDRGHSWEELIDQIEVQ